MICENCDPNLYVIYGYCKNCLRMCESPLWQEDLCAFDKYQEFRDKWNKEKECPEKE